MDSASTRVSDADRAGEFRDRLLTGPTMRVPGCVSEDISPTNTAGRVPLLADCVYGEEIEQ